jgi:hypothetical protein
MRERDELRTTIDGVMEDMTEAIDQSTAASIALRLAARAGDPEARKERIDQARDREREGRAAAVRLVPARGRLRLRLPESDPIVMAFQDIIRALRARHKAIRDALDKLEDEESREQQRAEILSSRKSIPVLGKQVSAFLKTTRDHFSEPAKKSRGFRRLFAAIKRHRKADHAVDG